MGIHAKVQSAPAFQQSDEVSANERCCWICENWVVQEVSYIPGWSGDTIEVENVFAYFSVDNFTRPTRLCKTLQRYHPRDFSLTGAHESPTGSRHVQQSLEEMPLPGLRQPVLVDGQVLCFSGSRMLPPTYDKIQVLFQVNETIVCADHLAKSLLPGAVHLRLHCEGRTSAAEPLPALPHALDHPAVEVVEANVIDVQRQARALFEQGAVDALCLTEDLRLRDAPVPPRALQLDYHRNSAWSFEKSVFKDYKRDSETVSECFRHDYALTRLEKFWKKHFKDRDAQSDASEVVEYLASVYPDIVVAYASESMADCASSRQSCSLSLAAFSRLLMSQSPDERTSDSAASHSFRRSRSIQASGEILKSRATVSSSLEQFHPLNRGFTFARADAIYTAVLVDLEHLNHRMPAGLPSDGLARFQLLEVLVCCAVAWGIGNPPSQAVRSFLTALGLGKQDVDTRRRLHEALFTQECCEILWRSLKLLQEVYHTYQKRDRIPSGVEATMMSYSAWLLFAADCKLHLLDVQDHRAAFALGKEICPDQHQSLRHMALSWSEFLVAIAAAVHLAHPFPDELADRLLDFLLDNLPEAARSGRAAEFAEAGEVVASLGSGDAKEVRLVALVSRVFNEADEDGSGVLSVRELSQALRQPWTQNSLEELGVVVDDVKLLFLRLDADDSGTISLKEFVDGLLKLRNEMMLLEKGVRAMRKAFVKIETKHSSCTGITKEQFLEYMRIPANSDALKEAGIQVADVNDLWQASQQAIACDANSVDLSAEALVAGYMDLHLEKGRIIRAMTFLNSIFQVADVDGSGSLSKEEVGRYLCRKEVTEKLQTLKLFVPDWLEIFEAMDSDGDGGLSWAELSTAMQCIWTQLAANEPVRSSVDGMESLTDGEDLLQHTGVNARRTSVRMDCSEQQ